MLKVVHDAEASNEPVVRIGHHGPREVMTAAGSIPVRALVRSGASSSAGSSSNDPTNQEEVSKSHDTPIDRS